MVSEKVSEKVAAPGRVKWPGAAERETLLPCRRVAHGHVKWPGAPEREKPHRPRRRSANGYVKGLGHECPLLMVGDVVHRVS
jgi:hypothetical protein